MNWNHNQRFHCFKTSCNEVSALKVDKQTLQERLDGLEVGTIAPLTKERDDTLEQLTVCGGQIRQLKVLRDQAISDLAVVQKDARDSRQKLGLLTALSATSSNRLNEERQKSESLEQRRLELERNLAGAENNARILEQRIQVSSSYLKG
jgi:hypothetical protein